MHSDPPSLQIHTFFNSPGSTLWPGPHIRLPKLLLNGGSSPSPVRNRHFDWRVRVIPYPKSPRVIYFPPPYKMLSASFSCYILYYSLIKHDNALSLPKIIPRESYCSGRNANKMLKHRETCCFVLTVKWHPSNKGIYGKFL